MRTIQTATPSHEQRIIPSLVATTRNICGYAIIPQPQKQLVLDLRVTVRDVYPMLKEASLEYHIRELLCEAIFREYCTEPQRHHLRFSILPIGEMKLHCTNRSASAKLASMYPNPMVARMLDESFTPSNEREKKDLESYRISDKLLLEHIDDVNPCVACATLRQTSIAGAYGRLRPYKRLLSLQQ